ncbi:MAG TPA: YncE family protein [Candidatus Acidoferrales bacterium]|nr:YncE family protein [Candidatus Acidoferrales bacterium]
MKKPFLSLAFALTLTGFICGLAPQLAAAADQPAPLKLVAHYTMPAEVKGRFDHLCADVTSNRLFLAAESAHEVLIFNLRSGKYVRAIPDIQIPHAIFVRDDINRIYVTDGGAGDLKIYDGKTYKLLKSAPLKVDADSIGYDPATKYLFIDNGGGDAHEAFSMFSIVDTTTGDKIADIKLDGETLEAMALDSSSPRIYVNNRARNEVSVIDRDAHSLVASWPVTMAKNNVAMALDNSTHRLFVACRSGAIVIFDTESGKELHSFPIDTGVDDLVFDSASKRLYAAAGGMVDVYREVDADLFQSLGKIVSGPGGKNEVLVPALHRLYITIPPGNNPPGSVAVFQVE